MITYTYTLYSRLTNLTCTKQKAKIGASVVYYPFYLPHFVNPSVIVLNKSIILLKKRTFTLEWLNIAVFEL